VLAGALGILALTLYTNQYFHGGVYGTLHNKSVRPTIEISNINLKNNQLQFEVYRTEGADVYGSFLLGIQLIAQNGQIVLDNKGADLANFPTSKIHNHYVAKVKPGTHSLVIPLGAKADLTLDLNQLDLKSDGPLLLKLIDISGLEWKKEII